MIFDALGEYAIGELPPYADSAVQNPFQALLAQPDIQIRYLIELYPYDEHKAVTRTWLPSPLGLTALGEIEATTYGGVETVYLSDMKFITEPGDNPANQYFSPRVNNPLQFDISLLNGENFGLTSPSFGAIRIENGDGEYDYLSGLSWKGRRVVIKAGGYDFRYDQFAIVFDGLCSGIELDEDSIILTLRDNGLKIEQSIVSPTYAGSGGIEGGTDLEGKMRPLLYGKAFNIEPVLVDPANLVYQIHAGSILAVDGVFDKGVALSFDQDVLDITAVTPGPGEYATSLTTGFIKLGSTPAGRITANARGDNTGGYVSTAGAVSRRILMTKLGTQSFSSAEIDEGAFNRLDEELAGDMGLFILENGPVRDYLDTLINPCGGYWYFTRNGRLTVGFIDEPDVETTVIDENSIDQRGIESPTQITPAWRITVAYAPVWVTQKEDELASAASDEQRAFVGQDYRTVVSEDRAVRSTHAQAVEKTFYTMLTEKADAEALLERLVRVYGTTRYVYRVITYGSLFRQYLGDTVRLMRSRYSIDKTMSVVGISEDAQQNQTTVELWG